MLFEGSFLRFVVCGLLLMVKITKKEDALVIGTKSGPDSYRDCAAGFSSVFSR